MEPGPRLFIIVRFHLFIYQDLHVQERLRENWSVGSNRSDGKVLTCGVDVKKGGSPPPPSLLKGSGALKSVFQSILSEQGNNDYYITMRTQQNTLKCFIFTWLSINKVLPSKLTDVLYIFKKQFCVISFHDE